MLSRCPTAPQQGVLHSKISAVRPRLAYMVARTRPPKRSPLFTFAERFYTQVKRDVARRQADELKRVGDAAGARKATRKAAGYDRQLKALERDAKRAQMERQRDKLAGEGIALAEAGNRVEARKVAKEAERLDREANRLSRS